VVGGGGVGDGEADRHLVEEGWPVQRHAGAREIVSNGEDEFVGAGAHFIGVEQRRIGAAVGVGGGGLDRLPPALGVDAKEENEQARSGLALVEVERVGGKFAGHDG
jgi:hypothetical protein